MILHFEIENYRGIVRLVAEPNGRSLTLTGENGAKIQAIDEKKLARVAARVLEAVPPRA